MWNYELRLRNDNRGFDLISRRIAKGAEAKSNELRASQLVLGQVKMFSNDLSGVR